MKLRHLLLSFIATLVIGNISVNETENNFIDSNNNVETYREPAKAGNFSSDYDFEIKMIDLQNKFGDSTLIRYKDINILIDAGGDKSSAPLILNALQDVDKLDYLIFTHADSDHIVNFVNPVGISMWLMGDGHYIDTLIDFDCPHKGDLYREPNDSNDEGYDKSLYMRYKVRRDSLIASKKIKNYHSAYDCVNKIGGGKPFYSFDGSKKNGLRILDNYFYSHSDGEMSENAKRNVLSVCTLITVNDKKFLFTGDLEEFDSARNVLNESNRDQFGKPYKRIYGETLMAGLNYNYLKDGVEFYKAAHHGSYTSNSSNLMDLIRPKYIGISAAVTPFKSNIRTEFPGQISLLAMEKWTDYIYFTNIYDEDSLHTDKPIINSYYGDIIYRYNIKRNKVEFTSSRLLAGDNLCEHGIIDSNLLNCRKSSLNVFVLNEDERTNNGLLFSFNRALSQRKEDKYNDIVSAVKNLNKKSNEIAGPNKLTNATYIKFGHIDILINFGRDSYFNGLNPNIEKVNKLCNDNVLDYLILSNNSVGSYSGLIGKNGLLKNTTIKQISNFYYFGTSGLELNEKNEKDMKEILHNKLINKATKRDSLSLNNDEIDLLTNNENFSLKLSFLDMPDKIGDINNYAEESHNLLSLMFNITVNYNNKQSFKYTNIGPNKNIETFNKVMEDNKSKLTNVDVVELLGHGHITDRNQTIVGNFKRNYLDMGDPVYIFNGTSFANDTSPYLDIYKPSKVFSTSIFKPKSSNKQQLKGGNIICSYLFGADKSDSTGRIRMIGSVNVDYFSKSIISNIELKYKRDIFISISKAFY